MKRVNMKGKKKLWDAWKKVLCMLLIVSMALPTNLVSFAAGEESEGQQNAESGPASASPAAGTGQEDVASAPGSDGQGNVASAPGSDEQGNVASAPGSDEQGNGASAPGSDEQGNSAPAPGSDGQGNGEGNSGDDSFVSSPDSEGNGEADSSESVVPAQPSDVTPDKEQVQLSVPRILYTPEEGGAVALTGAQSYDLSETAAEKTGSWAMELAVQLLKSGEERKVKAGDFITVNLRNPLLTAEETTEPVSISEGAYEIKNDVLTFTFNESGAGTDAAITVPVAFAFAADKLSETDNTTVEFALQQDNKISLIFGKKQPAAPEPSEAPDISVTPEPSVEPENPAVTPEPSVEPENPAVTPEPSVEPENPAVTPEPSVEPENPAVTPEPSKAPDADGTPGEENGKNDAVREKLANTFRVLFGNTHFMQAFDAATEKEYGGNHYTWTYKQDELPDGFYKIKLDVLNQTGGIKSTDENPMVKLQFHVQLDDGYLYEMSNPILNDPSFPQESDDPKAWYTAINTWLTKNSIKGFSYTKELGDIIDKTFTVAQKDGKPIPISPEGYDVPLGSYSVKGGTLYFEVNPICYFLDGVSMDFNFELGIDKNKVDKENPEDVTVNNGELVLETVGGVGGGSDPDEGPKYSITKNAVKGGTGEDSADPIDRTDKNYIDYVIHVEAPKAETAEETPKAKTLNGAVLTESVPDGMEITKSSAVLTYTYLDADGMEQTAETTVEKIDWSGKGNEKTYTFPTDTDKNYIKADFKVKLELTTDKYQEVINAGSMNTTFDNKATLSGKDGDKPYKVSAEISTDMKFDFLKKKGSAANPEGTKFAWTVEANTVLPKPEYGYVADTIDWTSHTYDLNNIIINGAAFSGVDTLTSAELSEKLKTAGKSLDNLKWENITAETLNAVFGTLNNNEGYLYFYDQTDKEGNEIPNPFYDKDAVDSKEPEFAQRAVLILPYNYKGENKYVLKYNSDLNMHGLTADAYTALIERKGYSPTVDNKVNLYWPDNGGIKPSAPTGDNVEIGKEVEDYVDPVVKKGYQYDPKTQKLSWMIRVNSLGNALTNVTLTDELKHGAYRDLEVVCTAFDVTRAEIGGSGKVCTGTESDDDSAITVEKPANRYTYKWSLAEKGGASGNDILKIKLPDTYFADAEKTQYTFYTVKLEMTLTDPTILSVQGKPTAGNTAKLTAVTPDGSKTWESPAAYDIPNTLIEKASVGSYNYTDSTFTWDITVNPNHINIMNAVITDKLYEDTGGTKEVWGDKTKVKIEAVTAINKEGTETDKTGMKVSPLEKDEAVTVDLGDIGTDTYVVSLTTTVTPEWKKTNLVTDGETKTVSVKNHVELDGKVVSGELSTAITDATAAAANTVTVEPAKKSGKYDSNTGKITWTVDINKYGYDLKNCSLKEDLTDGNADAPLIHELDVDSVKVYQGNVDGSYSEAPMADSGKNSEKFPGLSVSGFTYDFGEAPDTHAYRFVFDTYITEAGAAGGAAAGAKINNKVYLGDGESSWEDITNGSDGGYDGNFDFNQGATASTRPKFKLVKYSVNSSDPKDDATRYLLGDAKFSLSAHKYSIDKGTVTIGDEVPRYSKTGLTTKEGAITFLNLKTVENGATDLIYVLTESEAPAGYQLVDEPRFVGFEEKTEGIESISYGKATYTAKDSLTTIATSAGNTPPVEVTVVNEPKPIDKTPVTKKEIAGTDGTYATIKGVIFKIEAEEAPNDEDISGKVKTVYVTTDEGGEITFPDLDPGTYTMTEVYSPTKAMDVGGKLTLTVTAGEVQNTYALTAGTGTNHGLKYDAADKTIKNNLLTTALQLNKKVKYQDGEKGQIVAGNEEAIGAGVKFTLAWDAKVNEGTKYYETSTKSTDADGTVTFNDIPAGIYTLTETRPKGYGVPTEYKVTVTATDTTEVLGSTTTADGETVKYYGKKLEVAITPKADAAKDTIYNTPIKGTISFDKTFVDDTFNSYTSDSFATGMYPTKLVGAEFGLFRKIGTSVAAKAVYTATSGENGKVSFGTKDIPMVEYGDYVLKETKAPEGFTATQAEIEIKRTDLIPSTETGTPDTFDYTLTAPDCDPGSGTVKNKLVKQSVEITKKDMDGNLLKEVSFQLYRRGSDSVTNNNSLDIKPAAEIQTFYPYTYNVDTLTTDANGKLTLSDLPYGDYLLKETEDGLHLQDGEQKNAVYLKIEGTGVEYLHKVGFAGTYDEKDNYYTVDDFADVEMDAELDSTNNVYSFDITNYLKYAYIQLNKVVGETDSDGKVVPCMDKDGRKLPLAGATFSIYKVDAAGNAETDPYLVLTTDTNGNLPLATDDLTDLSRDGAYLYEGKYVHLLYGDYLIKETAAPEGFAVTAENSDGYRFTVGDGTDDAPGTGMEGTVWLTPDNKDAKVQYVKNGVAAPAEAYVYNTLERGSFTLKKGETDSEEVNLQGAEFVIKTKDKTPVAVASMEMTTSKDKDGKEIVTYSLSDKKSETEKYSEKKDGKYDYLDNTSGEWKLLFGDYTIEETTAPDGYEIAAPFDVTIADKVSLSGTPTNVTLTDGVITLKDEPVEITLEKAGEDSDTALANVGFKASGKFLGGATEKTLQTDKNGSITLTGMIAGEMYAIQETVPYPGYTTAGDFQITVQKDGTAVFEATPTDVTLDGLGSTITVTDRKNTVTIMKKASDDPTKKLSGAEFTVSGDFAGGATDPIKITVNEEESLKGKLIATTDLESPHIYTLKETKAPAGYQLPSDNQLEFYVEPDGTVVQKSAVGSFQIEGDTITVTDAPIEVTFEKLDEQTPGKALTGAEFTVSGKFVDGETEKTWPTDEIKNQLIGGEEYTFTETKAPAGYYMAEPFTVQVNTGGTVELLTDDRSDVACSGSTIRVTDRKNKLKLVKTDDEGKTINKSTGDSYTFTLSAPEGEKGYFTNPDIESVELTESAAELDGQLKVTTGTEEGKNQFTYTLTETKAPAGYKRITQAASFTVNPHGGITWKDSSEKITASAGTDGLVTITAKDAPITVTLKKTNVPEAGEAAVELDGAVFQVEGVFRDSGGKVTTKDWDGNTALSKLLLAGETYTVTEVTPPDGYSILEDSFTFSIDADGNLESTLKTELAEGTVTLDSNSNTITVRDGDTEAVILKKDAETGSVIPGATFKISGTFNGKVAGAGETEVEFSSGASLKNILLASTDEEEYLYTLEEVAAPAGYELQTGKIKFRLDAKGKITITDGSSGIASVTGDELNIYFEDEPIEVSLKKQDDSEEPEPLGGVKFNLSSANDDRYPTDDPTEITTGEDGNFLFVQGEDYVGLAQDKTYTLTEAENYQDYHWPNGQPPSVTFTVDTDGTIAIETAAPSGVFQVNDTGDGLIATNQRMTASLGLEKTDADTDGSLDGVLFLLSYEGEGEDEILGTVPSYDGTPYITEKGKLTIPGLIKGSYVLTEGAAGSGYLLGSKPFTAEFEITDEDYNKVLDITRLTMTKEVEKKFVKDGKITNKQTRLDITKTGEDGQPLAGAEFTLTPAKGSAFVDSTRKTYTAATDENGKISITKILAPNNDYLVEETKTPGGYITVPKFQIHYDADGVVSLVPGKSDGDGGAAPANVIVDESGIGITVKNDQNNITLVKTDRDGKPLTGGEFKITGTFAKEIDGKIPTEITVDLSKPKEAADALKGQFYATADDESTDTDGPGRYVYTAAELTAPAGYELPSKGTSEATPIQFTVDSQGALSIVSDGGSMPGSDGASSKIPMATAGTDEGGKQTVLSVKNEKLEIHWKKYGRDIKDSINGAEFEVTGDFVEADGTISKGITKQWKDGSNALPDGSMFIGGSDYVFEETKAPDGYELAKQVAVRVDKYGNINVLSEGPGKADTENPDTLIITDEPIEVLLKKVNASSEPEAPLSHIEFLLTSADDERKGYKEGIKVVTGTKGTQNGVFLFAQSENGTDDPTETKPEEKLKGTGPERKPVGFYQGKTYTLTETSDYDDYHTANPSVTFKVKDDGTVEFVGRYDTEVFSLEDGGATIKVKNHRADASLLLEKTDSSSGAGLAGVTFALQYKRTSGSQGTVPDYAAGRYTTEAGGRLLIGGLVKGTYTITETGAAPGYTMGSEPFEATFVINDSNDKSTLVLANLTVTKGKNHVTEDNTKITNDRLSGSVRLSKTGSDGKTPLAGVTFTLFSSSGTKLGDYKTDEKGQLAVYGLSWGSYYLQETGPLPGYLPNDKKYEFGVGGGSLNADLGTVKNTQSKVSLEKVGADGKALPGVELAVTGKFADGSTSYKWLTDGKALGLEGILQAGEKYTVTEVSAAKGYVKLGGAVEFTMGTDGVLTLTANPDGLAAVTDEGHRLVITNKQTVADITKTDEGGKPLAGASLAVKDASGKVLAAWTSEDKAHTLTGLLNPGERYTLSEISAPNGYRIAQDIKFTVPADGRVTVTMADEKVPDGGKGNGSVTVTKTLYFGEEPLAVEGLSFYTALFSDEALTKRVSEVKELALNGSYNTAVTFSGLPMGTYYVAETDAEGNVYDGADLGMVVEITNQECTLAKASPHGSAVIKNILAEPPEGGYIKPDGKVIVDKKIVYKGKAVSVKNESFYVTLFADEDFTQIAYGPAEIVIKGASSATVVFDKVAWGTYYLAETDEDGFLVDPEEADFGYSPSFSEGIVTIADAGQEEKVTLTNTVLSTAEPSVTPTLTPVPGGGSGGSSGGGGSVEPISKEETIRRTPTKTGDETNAMPYLFLLLAGAAGVLTAARRRRRR